MAYNQLSQESPMSPSSGAPQTQPSQGMQLHPAVAHAFRQKLMGGRPMGAPGQPNGVQTPGGPNNRPGGGDFNGGGGGPMPFPPGGDAGRGFGGGGPMGFPPKNNGWGTPTENPISPSNGAGWDQAALTQTNPQSIFSSATATAGPQAGAWGQDSLIGGGGPMPFPPGGGDAGRGFGGGGPMPFPPGQNGPMGFQPYQGSGLTDSTLGNVPIEARRVPWGPGTRGNGIAPPPNGPSGWDWYANK